MKANYVKVLNLILENEIEQAKTELESFIADYDKSNHNTPRSIYNHSMSNIFDAVGLSYDEMTNISLEIVAKMGRPNISNQSHLVEIIESTPLAVNQKMVMFNFINSALKYIDERDSNF